MRTTLYLLAIGVFILWAYFPVIRIARDAWQDLQRDKDFEDWAEELER